MIYGNTKQMRRLVRKRDSGHILRTQESVSIPSAVIAGSPESKGMSLEFILYLINYDFCCSSRSRKFQGL